MSRLSNPLAQALAQTSPRYSRSPHARTPMRSVLIHGTVLVLWVLLLWGAFAQHNFLAWSVGMVYAAYDTALLAFVAWQARRLLHPPSQAKSHQHLDTPPARLAVIVAAHNERSVLSGTIEALLRQANPPDQILIADDGSSDGSELLLTQRYGLVAPALGSVSQPSPSHPSLQWARLPHGGKARALNAALLDVQADIVITVDADTHLERGAIAEVRRAFDSEPALVAATGVITPKCGSGWRARLLQEFQTYEYMRNFLSRHAWMQLNSLLLVSGAFAAFRTSAVLEVGGFDPQCWVEDYELIHRLHHYGQDHQRAWVVRVLGHARAQTDAPSTVGAFLRQRRRWFGGFLQTQYWYRDMVGDPHRGALGTRMLPVKAADTLQPLYGLTAISLLIGFVLMGRWQVLVPAAGVIAVKTVLDIAYHVWSVRVYRRWLGDEHRGSLIKAALAALAEPFTFQLLRHCAAAWGWWSVLTGQAQWGRAQRAAALESVESLPATGD